MVSIDGAAIEGDAGRAELVHATLVWMLPLIKCMSADAPCIAPVREVVNLKDFHRLMLYFSLEPIGL